MRRPTNFLVSQEKSNVEVIEKEVENALIQLHTHDYSEGRHMLVIEMFQR